MSADTAEFKKILEEAYSKYAAFFSDTKFENWVDLYRVHTGEWKVNSGPIATPTVHLAKLCGARKRKNQRCELQNCLPDQVVFVRHGEYFVAQNSTPKTYRLESSVVSERNFFRTTRDEAIRIQAAHDEKGFCDAMIELASKLDEVKM